MYELREGEWALAVTESLISDIVVALAAHFEARERAILTKSVTTRVRMEYVYINSKMLDAAAEIVGIKYAKQFILDIGRGIGYANTKTDAFSETSYKKSKMEVKRRIAEKLNLLDPLPHDFMENKN